MFGRKKIKSKLELLIQAVAELRVEVCKLALMAECPAAAVPLPNGKSVVVDFEARPDLLKQQFKSDRRRIEELERAVEQIRKGGAEPESPAPIPARQLGQESAYLTRERVQAELDKIQWDIEARHSLTVPADLDAAKRALLWVLDPVRNATPREIRTLKEAVANISDGASPCSPWPAGAR